MKPAQTAFWGGHSGYFSDPDGIPWEVAWNPGFLLSADGSVRSLSDHNGHLRDHSLSPGSGAQKAVHTRAKTQQQADDQPPRNPVLVILALVFLLWVEACPWPCQCWPS